jgi:transposase-like protein
MARIAQACTRSVHHMSVVLEGDALSIEFPKGECRSHSYAVNPLMEWTPKVRQRVKGANTLNGVRNGFVPSCLQSRFKDIGHGALDAGTAAGELARKYQLSPKLLERWRGEWRAKGDLAFPGIGRRGVSEPALDDAHRISMLVQREMESGRSPIVSIARAARRIVLRDSTG